jgi:hypothetical protein
MGETVHIPTARCQPDFVRAAVVCVDVQPQERRHLAIELLRAYHAEGVDDREAVEAQLAGHELVDAFLGMLWLADQVLGLYATGTYSNAEEILGSIAEVVADEDASGDS